MSSYIRETNREKRREGKREKESVCVCVCVCEREREREREREMNACIYMHTMLVGKLYGQDRG